MDVAALLIAGLSLVATTVFAIRSEIVRQRTLKLERKLARWDDKKAIHDCVLEHLAELKSGVAAGRGTSMDLRRNTRDARLYFESEVTEFIENVCRVTDELAEKAQAYHEYVGKNPSAPPDEEVKRLKQEWDEADSRASALMDRAKEVFKPYLRL